MKHFNELSDVVNLFMKNYLSLNKNRFNYTEVIEPSEDYNSFANEINELIEAGLIRAIKKSGKVRFAPYFWKEYFINKSTLEQTKVSLSEINQLAPSLIEYYIGHPDHYLEDKSELLLLNEWLKNGDKTIECSVKERSFEIFRREKALEGETCSRIMNRCRMTYSDLNCYRTYEPFFYTKISEKGCALILENKDPWYSIAKALEKENTNRIFHKEIMYLIYGEGKKADSKEDGSRIIDFIQNLPLQPEECFYCGDIDRAGVVIFTKCQEVNAELNIKPFMPLYEKMLEKALDFWDENEKAEDNKTKKFDEGFAEFFNNPEYIREVLYENLRIPQEILSLKDYLEVCG